MTGRTAIPITDAAATTDRNGNTQGRPVAAAYSARPGLRVRCGTGLRLLAAPATMERATTADPTPTTTVTTSRVAGVADTPRPTSGRLCPMTTATDVSCDLPMPTTADPIRSCGTAGIIPTGDPAHPDANEGRARDGRGLFPVPGISRPAYHHPPEKRSCRSKASRGSGGRLDDFAYRFACGRASVDVWARGFEDVLVDKSGKITGLVIGVGGFLGAGEKDVIVPFTAVKTAKKNDKWRLTLDETKDALKGAPGFKYDRASTTWVPEKR